jgi:hypothetical protein
MKGSASLERYEVGPESSEGLRINRLFLIGNVKDSNKLVALQPVGGYLVNIKDKDLRI